MSPEIAYRAAEPGDINFILSSWLRSYRPSAPLVSDAVYFDQHKALARRLLARCEVQVACDPDYPASVFGYVVSEGKTLHYVYVKFSLRRFGVAKALLERAGIKRGFTASHVTPTALRLLVSDPSLFVFNPYEALK